MSETCSECDEETETPNPAHNMCKSCSEDQAMQNLAQVEPPEGGWSRGSDMDRL